ncbi:hypothetical protein RS130_19370 [Paraglaciecola aquimarina]|uniref:Uncharacterized protein n=1 Tax=Paraglaciecola aquimarina TaxID=1235557 RepID=A0ABU3T0P7_9ALTE|nr:hypothetical protein [Paraglaciecola aquimarina]MDU0355752.1 hypothetical protein [Paraglaciecola aquimarina]
MINISEGLVITNEKLFPALFEQRLKNLLEIIEKYKGLVPRDYANITEPNAIGRNAFQYYIAQVTFSSELLQELYSFLYVDIKTRRN